MARPVTPDANDKNQRLPAFYSSILFPTHQFLGLNEEPVSLRTFFASIRNRECFQDNFCSIIPESTYQQPTAFIGVVAFAVEVNLPDLLAGN